MKLSPMIVLAATLTASAEAAPNEAAFAAFAGGDYENAATLARVAGSAEDHALAARAMNARAYFEADRKASRKLAGGAIDDAERAMKIDPALPEAHLQAAIGEGLRAANMAPARAFVLNLPNRVRKHLDAAMKIDADNPWALSTSAAWRLEVARRGGGAAYHAKPEEGFAEFKRAREIAPGNVVVGYECALRLLAAARPEWRGFGLACLDAALASAPETAFDKGVQARARAFKGAVEKGETAEAAYIAAQP